MIGKRFELPDMIIEIISDNGDSWKTRCIATKKTDLMNKQVLQNAIRLGRAKEVSKL
ncbi:MAG: hypothetical protein OQK25_07575 [Gammaproteobacteria bacterium]|nr:hypothetical protein [Gammaproteobacteria bacterium]